MRVKPMATSTLCLVTAGTCALPPLACPADWLGIYFSSMWEAHASLPSATIHFLLLLKQLEKYL